MAVPRKEFKIVPATEEDAVALAEVESIANEEANLSRGQKNVSHVIFGPPNEVKHNFRAKGLVEKMKNDPFVRNWKAVVEEDGQEKIVGWANWFFYTEPQPIETKEIDWPAGMNAKGCNEFIGALTAMRAKYQTGRKFGYLQVLATLPGYRGNGIGSGLLEIGLAEARRAGLNEFFLEASDDGHDLYAKFGFKDLERTLIDLVPYGGEGQAQTRAMRILPN
ncbi:uncharacterized protein N7498_007643 [Penicillium cinerascens]|uniref:N-acetyltransferase domain-containing protein n=1 Tax=Penicillium cinerascens TaxID=70096 RepID=A0A9W9JR49_9EURO|nr:uncharacterized protein N7498_007643 [Penicillium cinerascens]KAJ5198526.1 hypothetical protein N7498_007643 [Penicillium cinerascens]